MLIEAGAETEVGGDSKAMTPMIAAAGRGKVGALRTLMEGGANKDGVGLLGTTPLTVACTAGHFDSVKFLVESGADLNHASDCGKTALAAAAEQENPEILRYLIEAGAKDPNLKVSAGIYS